MNRRIRTATLGAAAALALALPAVQGNAAVVYATSVDAYTQGAGVVPARANPATTLGAPDGKFLSLGLGGSVRFGFGTRFNATGAVFEITRGNPRRSLESVEIYGVLNGMLSLLGSLTNTDDGTFSFVGVFDQLVFLDTSPKGGGSKDGYDIDALNVTPAPVPLPAGGLLLLGAVAAMAGLKRRRG